MQQRCAQGGPAFGEPPLLTHVLRFALRRLDRHGDHLPGAEVVRGGLHVEQPNVSGELERVEQQLSGDQGTELRRPLVQVHSGVQAAGLFEQRLLLAGQRGAIARHRLRGEETEGIEVGAAQFMALDDRVSACPSESQRHGMAVLVGAVDHGPLVQPEAAELPRPRGGAPQHPLDEPGEVGLLRSERGGVGDHGIRRAAGGVPPPPRPLRSGLELDARPRMPATQLRGFVAVIREQEVEHRMLLAALRANAMLSGQRIRPLVVGALAFEPFAACQSHVS